MKIFKFYLNKIKSLNEEINIGFVSASFKSAIHGKPVSITLWRSDGTGLRIKNRMHDVAERIECGVLELDIIMAHEKDEMAINLPFDLKGKIFFKKLVLKDNLVFCDSGLIFFGSCGSELIIVAGAYPYTLAFSVGRFHGEIDSEFPIDKYERLPI